MIGRLLKLATVAVIGVSCGVLAVQPAMAAKNVLVIGKAEDPRTIDPAISMSNNAWSVTYPAYERLIEYRGEGIAGQLAESWSVENDLVWTFKLKKGHKFTDGSPVDAKAVKFSLDRLLKLKGGAAEAFPTLEKTEVVDDYTVRFTLNAPFAPFLFALANNGAAIINPKVMAHEKDGDMAQAWLSEHTAGSGSFGLANWEKGQSILMTPNPNYAGAKPAFKRVVFKLIKEPSARRLQLERGDLDIAENMPIDQMNALQGKPGIHIEDNPSFFVTYLYLNNKRPALSDPRVRQAISYAVDYQGIIDGILLGNGVQMRGPVPQGMWSHDPKAFQYHRDLGKAKALLKEAGVSNLKLGYLYATRDPNWEPIGLTLQSNLRDIGITVELQSFAYATMRDKLNQGDFDIAVGNWTPDYYDPHMFMNYWFDSKLHGLPGDRAFYTNAEVDKLIRKAARISDQAERTALYQQAQKIVIKEAPYVYLFQKNNRWPMRSRVKGYVYNPMTLDIYNIGTMSKAE